MMRRKLLEGGSKGLRAGSWDKGQGRKERRVDLADL